MIGSVSYVGMNVRVWYMCSGSVLCMLPLKIVMGELDNLLGGSFEEFSTLNNFKRTGFILGCENWDRYDFTALLRLVKSLYY